MIARARVGGGCHGVFLNFNVVTIIVVLFAFSVSCRRL